MDQSTISALVSRHTGQPFKAESVTSVSSGPRWQTWCIDNARTGTPKRIFAKVGEADVLRLSEVRGTSLGRQGRSQGDSDLAQSEIGTIFAAEADGLNRLSAASSVLRIPKVIACETLDEQALLLLEWIDLAPLTPVVAALLGHGLAAMHRNTGEQFGLDTDNFIGATPQRNTPDKDWVCFWQMNRLMPQLALCAKKRYPSRMLDRGERLMADCGAFFRDYIPAPSLLHGDLWTGNVAQDDAGLPVSFDPAVYYGDREADIALTELFGGFPPDFRAAYDNAWPLDAGYGVRKHFYNLYHLLNHANLFAGEYVRDSEKLIERLLAEVS